jgi:hypothetical protein
VGPVVLKELKAVYKHRKAIKNVLQTVSLPHLRNVLEMGGLPCGISEDLPSRELASRKSYIILSRMSPPATNVGSHP